MLALATVVGVVKQYTLDVNFLQFVIGVLIPIAVALITKSSASSAVKAVTQIVLATLIVALQRVLTANGVVDLQTFLTTLLMTEIIAIASYYGLLKHTINPPVAKATARFGITGPARL